MSVGFVYWVWGANNPCYPLSETHPQSSQELPNDREANETLSMDTSENRLIGAKGRKLPPVAKSNKYKTKMCRNFMETGKCRYGRVCQFAHGTKELKKYSLCVYCHKPPGNDSTNSPESETHCYHQLLIINNYLTASTNSTNMGCALCFHDPFRCFGSLFWNVYEKRDETLYTFHDLVLTIL